ncbi:hypothetical protein EJ04DRAFT_277525 [Polyplosphaeria fusca]|uniref:Uncharacterized protein n=1 Tax=Polyplosphaeria fusca TaxID=682080 RepID=A0A9P4QVE6_9PLEO|nr:hypothetical protein EJ04DRAFT_277525 [Polyplosphaeria fusca]
MIDLRREDGPNSKFYFTHTLLPSYIDPNNTSQKKKPFSTFLGQPFTYSVDLVLPEEIYELVKTELEAGDEARLQYSRVYMKLGELLEGDFFSEYVKNGKIIMLSEGRPLVDNAFSLHEGTLRLELDRSTYERCGLQGEPIEDGGKKHQKARWVIKFDLRAPNMVHGKKGFSRLQWACKNVLNQSLTWLFYKSNPPSTKALPEGSEPISQHHPFVHSVTPTATILQNISVPMMTVTDLDRLYEQEQSLSLLEWLSLVELHSPRVRKADRIDSFLSRYEVPDFGKSLCTKNLVHVNWRGFIPAQFVKDLHLLVRKFGLKVARDEHDGEGGTKNQDEDRWFALTGRAFEGYGGCYTVMQFAGRDTVTWECE